MKNENSLTGQYLSGKKFIPLPKERRERQMEVLLKLKVLRKII